MISLLDLDPDFRGLLSDAERGVARGVAVAVHTVDSKAGSDVNALLHANGGFGLAVLDGLLLQRLRVGDQEGLRLLGPDDVILPGRAPRMMSLAESDLTALDGARLALLDHAVLHAVRRWPALMLQLLARAAESSQMLEAQLVICQLPRVDQRISAVLWLFAERWGHVTSSGTRLALHLTHETLGMLIGARRPTVTLALNELADRGELISTPGGWLLLGAPPDGEVTLHMHVEMPSLPGPAASVWDARTPPPNLIAYGQAIRGESRREREVSARVRKRSLELGARFHDLRRSTARPGR